LAGKPSKPLDWIASSLKDLKALPVRLQKAFGTALHLVQLGDTPLGAASLKGFGGAAVLELAEDFDRATYRAVSEDAVHVLRVFQKKSKRGIATPARDIEPVKQHRRLASEHYASSPGREDHSD
jgi:phage-related protein